MPRKPILFISYSHLDEPENPGEGEVRWLSFVVGHLRPAEKHGAVEIWLDRLIEGGADWSQEIEGRMVETKSERMSASFQRAQWRVWEATLALHQRANEIFRRVFLPGRPCVGLAPLMEQLIVVIEFRSLQPAPQKINSLHRSVTDR